MQTQTPSLILPTTYAAGTGTLASTETIADVAEHTSVEFFCNTLQEKTVHIMAVEAALAPAAVPGNLWCWIELSPYPTANGNLWQWPLPTSTLFWAAIGGGGGAIAPVAPHIEVSGLGGAAGTLTHGIILPWAIHSYWARVVVQTPVAAALPLAFWTVQVLVSGKTP